MKNFYYDKVKITDGFLHQKQTLNEDVTINAVYDRFYDTGRIDAFKMEWKEGMVNKPHIFWDSDVAKWIEGVAYILKNKKDKDLEKKADAIIDNIEKNQCEDGYYNSYFTVCEPERRFQSRPSHELYCAGHLIEAAVAYFEATGKDKFLKCMEKYADYIYKVFAVEQSANFLTPGHEEIELALLRLYRLTKNVKYLELCKFFVNNRCNKHDFWLPGESYYDYDQSHLPVREQLEAVGHCVRACYLYTAMADLAYEIKDEGLEKACKAIFKDIVNQKMYITGGLGSTRHGERFTIPYDLPNETAYAETCASISMMFFASKMQQLENKAVYADVIEREIYNGMLSGVSLDGERFFYENPLEINLENHRRRTGEQLPITQRVRIFECSCCPPNINRVLSSFGNYIFGYEKDTVFVNQFTNCELNDGKIKVNMKTAYPYNGKIEISYSGVGKIAVRIPSWCTKYTISEKYEIKDGYAYITSKTDTVSIDFEMKPVLIEANSNVRENRGKAAVCCGPLVYCAEGVDNKDLYKLYIDKNITVRKEFDEYFNADVLYVKGFKKITGNELYAPLSDNYEKCEIKMIPYFGFANREETDMLVFMQYK